ncbi:MAG TPA: peptide ABC transporter substrate-binding protein [Rhizomicrobium sp.]
MKRWLPALLLLASAARAETVLNRGNGAEPDSLDPAQVSTTAETNILGDLMVGLTTYDAAARPMPGIAERWDVSPDGLTWTFHLRDARWSDNNKVTAQDFVLAWRRLQAPATAARGAANLWIVRNARGVSSGALPPTALGVTAPDAHTLIVVLEHPAPYLPELLTLPAALPLPPKPARPGTLTDGPYVLKTWTPGDHIALARNPRFYDAASVRIDTVNYFSTPDAESALRRLRAGELDMQSPLPSAQVAWMRANMAGALHVMPSLALAYIVFNLRDPALADFRVRRALNLVYDREAVARKVMKLGETPAYSYVPPNLSGYGRGPAFDFKPLPYAVRLAEAKNLMQQAGYGPFNKLRLTYATSGNPDSKRLAAVFQAMARQVYVDVRIQTADQAVNLRNYRQGQFQLGYATWLADYGEAGNFLDLLRSAAPNNYAGYRNLKFDAAMAAADRAPDAARRTALLQQAERIALADMPWLAVRFLSQSEAVGPRVGGYVANARDFNRSRWLWIRK